MLSERLKCIYEKHKETILYLFYGFLSFALNVILFMVLDITFNDMISNTIAFLITMVFSYITNSKFIFNKKIQLKTFLQFALMRSGTIVFDNGGMWLFLILFKNKLTAKIIVNIIIIIINYIFSKFIIFRKEKAGLT